MEAKDRGEKRKRHLASSKQFVSADPDTSHLIKSKMQDSFLTKH